MIEFRTDSSITSDDPAFVPTPTAVDVPARDSVTISVRFTPPSAGTFAATLTIVSDDPDEGVLQIPLAGTAIEPPVIEISPESLASTLLEGEQESRIVTISNAGASDLTWTVETLRPAGAAAAAWVPPSGELPASTSSDVRPAGVEAVETQPSVQAGARVLLVQDYAPWGSTANERVLQANDIAFDRATTGGLASVDLSAYDLVIVASDQSTASYQNLAARMAQLDAFVAAGGTLEFHAAGWGWNGGDACLVPLPGGVRIQYGTSQTNFVVAPDHPVSGTRGRPSRQRSAPGRGAVRALR